MHMLSKERPGLRRIGDRSSTPKLHNGYHSQCDLFVRVQILKDTPAVLSLGNSAKKTDVHMEWCNTDNFEPKVVPG